MSNEDLVTRLGRWFPYLDELVARRRRLPAADDRDCDRRPRIRRRSSRVGLRCSPWVHASSIQQALGRVSRHLAWAMGLLSAVLLAGAVLLAAVWVHLELFRHADEITIMRLVGATERTIRGPFLVAVAIPGAVAAVLSIVGSMTSDRQPSTGLSRLTSDLGLSPITVPPPTVLVVQAAAGPRAARCRSRAHSCPTRHRRARRLKKCDPRGSALRYSNLVA